MEQKILAHMNKDHKLALEDYLVVYGKIKLNKDINNIKLKSIEKNQLLLSFKHKDINFEIEKSIPIEPPMNDIIKESRVRLVEMAKEAASKRGYSHIQIKKIIYPHTFFEILILVLVYIMVFGYIKPEIFYDLIVFEYLKVPKTNQLINFLKNYNDIIFYSTMLIHFSEYLFVFRPKIIKYRVPIDISIEWFIACMFEGAGAINRFNKLIPN